MERDGTFSFVGLEDAYFAAVVLPEGNGTTNTTIFNDSVPTASDQSDQPFIGDAVGGKGTNQFELFVGPKDLELLKKVNPKLEQIVDFGYMWFLAKPLFLALRFLDHAYVRNYGWSIVVATIFINFCLFPLRMFNMKSMKKMQALQPKIQAINEKYKGLGMRDPKMAQKNEETMALYKENGANPMAGCLPMLIQMPFLIAFYKVLAVSIEMRGANWMWVTDLSQPEHRGDDYHQLPDAADDTHHRYGPVPAAHDDVHAAGDGLLLLQPIERAGVILAHWKFDGYRPAVFLQ